MSEDQLHAVFLKIPLLHFTDNSLKVNDDDHLLLMALPPCKIEPAALELIHPVRLRLHKVRIVYQLLEPPHPSVLLLVVKPSCSLGGIASIHKLLLMLLLHAVLAEFDQLSLKGLAHLHLCEWLLASYLYVIAVLLHSSLVDHVVGL